MTREEAIKILKDLSDCSYIGSLASEDIEALKMAIKALEQEPTDSSGLMLVDEFVERKVNRTLDKIRAEIEIEADTSNRLNGISEIGLRKALKIIDKYKAESEDKE